jgi:hypothetical protein
MLSKSRNETMSFCSAAMFIAIELKLDVEPSKVREIDPSALLLKWRR